MLASRAAALALSKVSANMVLGAVEHFRRPRTRHDEAFGLLV